MTTFRKIIFWTHLACGLVAGVVIAIMSATGVAIAFEQEILGLIDREAVFVTAPDTGVKLTLEQQRAALAAARPDFTPTSAILLSHPQMASRFMAGREQMLYVNPYTGAVTAPRSGPAHDVLHTLEEWHRWLGAKDGATSTARLVTGICNVAFLGLCVTGLYLWFPRSWSRRALRPLLWFVGDFRGKARDFNWHNVIGLWSAPVLIVLVATGVVISFGWAHDFVFRAAGEAPPKFRDFRMMMVRAPDLPAPAPGATPLPLDTIVARMIGDHPDWRAISFTFPKSGGAPAPLDITIIDPAPFMTAGRVMKHVDPFTGTTLQSTAFADRSPGLRARIWVRFLHTGEAFGLPSKIIATLATAASLFLVWTGFALSWRRFFPKRAKPVPSN